MEMSENQKNYIPLIAPLKKSIQELSKRESREYFEWFVSHIDERADYLKEKVSNGLNIPIESLDFSLESLKAIWEWFLSVAEVSKTSKDDLKRLERSLTGHPQSFIDSILEQSKERLNVFTEYVLRDVGMYVAKMFTSTTLF